MSFQLDFQNRSLYKSLATGITIDTVLRYGISETICLAKVDTGSDVCLFERGVAEFLEIDVESGYAKKFSTLTGDLIAYGHEIELETLGLRFQSFVYFPDSYTVRRNLLGRQGWLHLIKLGLVDHDCELYISPYDQ